MACVQAACQCRGCSARLRHCLHTHAAAPRPYGPRWPNTACISSSGSRRCISASSSCGSHWSVRKTMSIGLPVCACCLRARACAAGTCHRWCGCCGCCCTCVSHQGAPLLRVSSPMKLKTPRETRSTAPDAARRGKVRAKHSLWCGPCVPHAKSPCQQKRDTNQF